MSNVYYTIAGDTFAIIARKKYGTEEKASLISNSNPGLLEPLSRGLSIIIPNDPNAPSNILQTASASNENEVALLINNKRFRFWTSIAVSESIDSMSLISFAAPFDSDLAIFRETFKPFSYQDAVFTVGGEPWFTGKLLPSPSTLGDKVTIVMNGYSNPGVLGDCPAPASAYPLEFNNQGLRDIAVKLSSLFGIAVEFDGDQGQVFERVAIEIGEKILTFLTKLAQERNFVISSTNTGKLLIHRSIETGIPVAKLRQGESPLVSITPNFNSQNYYSHVTGMQPAFFGVPGEQFTVKNPLLEDVVRPFVYKAPDTEGANIKDSVQAKAGRMFGNMASYSVVVDTWRDPQGDKWQSNTILSLLAPDAMIYNEYDFLIRSIEFDRNDVSESAILDVVMPGAFSGKIPERLPWDE